ncbi:hypothetical protein Daura_28160 [Dactylosporangium aurantiacum]|uniref:JmjC domain-containing protein n=1 Tax=Dactylosporangium aurantiacum TaxID=35754 RepID=A0A9Q9M9F7_9ACTN|nr:hypothetical protein [Dactylosporangium aurantiacum]MDG6106947.1 hypothetical protein [Dactylosporangium aurantiacum]UWZ50693.1 hypothetical protein Daura_28160 [Dactylosporangium aurantiacum]
MSQVPAITLLDPGAACSAVRWDVPALTTAVAWQAVAATAAGDGTGSVKVFQGGRPASSRVLRPDPAQPGATGRSGVERFLALPGPTFCYARDVQAWHRPLFEAMVEALTPHLMSGGLGSGPVETEVFAGDYQRTPGGVHREACSNVHLVLAGAKTMHLWTGDDWMPPGVLRRGDVAAGAGTREEYLPTLNPAVALAAGRSLTGGPGQGFAWVAGTWHVAETHGPSAALNIAMYQHGLGAEPSLPVWGDRLDGAVPASFLDDYRRHVGAGAMPLAALLGRLSALGMRPAAVHRRPGPVRTVRRGLAVPILWVRPAPGELFVATLGAVRRLPPRTPVDWLAERWERAELTVPEEAAGLAGWLCLQGALEAKGER